MSANVGLVRMLRRGTEGGYLTDNVMVSRRADMRMYMLASKVCRLALLSAHGFVNTNFFSLLFNLLSYVPACTYVKQGLN